jgi:hypothetical protein
MAGSNRGPSVRAPQAIIANHNLSGHALLTGLQAQYTPMISPTTLLKTPLGSKFSRTALNLAMCCYSVSEVCPVLDMRSG